MPNDSVNESLFTVCPRCGSNGLCQQTDIRYCCKQCGFIFFLNTAAAVAALITDREGRLLVTIRAQEPFKGSWDLPGGFVDPNESAEDALKREISEELSVAVESFQYLFSVPNIYHYLEVDYYTVDLAFSCLVRDLDDIKPGDDVRDFLFVPFDKVDLRRFGLRSIKEIVHRYLNI